MNPEKLPLAAKQEEEIPALIETLLATEQRLEELTAGEVDTVASRDGRTFLLRHAEEQLRRNAAGKQASILNALSAHIALLDAEGNIVSVNEAWKRFGDENSLRARGQGMGLNYLDICDGGRGDYASEAAQVAAGLRAVLAGSETIFSIEYPCHSPTKQRWFLLTATPLADHHPHGAIVMHLDITERKASEMTSTWLAAIVESSGDAIIGQDPNGNVTSWNEGAEKIFGYTAGEMLGVSMLRLVPNDRQDEAKQILGKVRRGERVKHFETQRVTREGRVIDVAVTASPIKDAAGRVIGVSKIARDITEQRRADEELRDSEERFSGAFEHAPIGMALVSPEGRWLKVNRALCDFLGYSETEFLSSTFQNITHPDDLEQSLEQVSRAIAGEGRSLQIEKRYFHKQGQVVTAALSISLVRDGQGHPRYFVSQIQDITARKHAEEEVKRSQKRLRDLIDGMGPDMFVGLLTPEGILVEVNQPPLTAAGLEPEDVLGKPFAETPWWSHSPEVQGQLRDAILRAALGEASRYDVRTQGAGGEMIDIDFSLQPLRDEAGEIVFLIPSASVITERKRAEKALNELSRRTERRERMLTTTLSSLDDFAYILDRRGRFLFANQPLLNLWGISLEEAVGKNFFELGYPSDLAAQLQQQVQQVFRTGKSLRDETPYISPAGLKGYYEYILSPALAADGTADFVVGSTRDVTERKRVEKKLVETSRKAGMAEMATGVLHNVGNVLNSVSVASSCLARSLQKSTAANLSRVVAMLREHESDLGVFLTSDPKGKQVPAYLAKLAEHLAGEKENALKELAQLQANIEHIKEVVTTQQSSAKTAAKSEMLRATDLVEQTLQMDSGGPASHEIVVIKQFDSGALIKVEKHKVLQILMNLVRNAKQACQETGGGEKRLTLRVTEEGGKVRIEVTDNGVGIPTENLPGIFAHGFTTKQDGHGFGLHSALMAAKEMGGSLTVQSGGAGYGATFALELPLAQECDQDLIAA
ncbi:MAG: multi-sensor signal transduction histidine kinase [Verrucomicrobiales bacterium]|nr:multi-sensor signal transduction histidine kinase [Verrucomicrobiales bacterium]